MPDPDYLKEGKGLDPEAFADEMEKLKDETEDRRKKERKEAKEQEKKERKEAEERGELVDSPTPAKDAAGPQGNLTPGADDQVFGPTQATEPQVAPGVKLEEHNQAEAEKAEKAAENDKSSSARGRSAKSNNS